MKYTRIGSRVVFGALTSTLLGACGSIPRMDAERYVTPLSGATVTGNLTNYTRQLDCLGNYLQQANLPPSRFAVGRVDDYSGKQDLVNGKRMTQGAALMVISALAHTRLPIVERLDTSVAEMELKYTDNKLIGDATSSPENPFRRTVAGTVIGSDYHIVGGITEVNYNIRSGSLETTVSSIGASGRYAVLDVAIDLRLVNTRTLQVVGVASVQKQIIGTEIRAGIFRFLSDSVIDINAADKAQEPIQKAVRMLTERAVFQLVSGVYKVPAGQCDGPAATTQAAAAIVPIKSVNAIPAPAAPAVPAPSSGPALQPPADLRTPARKTTAGPAPVATPGQASTPSSLTLRLSDVLLLAKARVQSTPDIVDPPAADSFAAAPVASASAVLEMAHN